MPAKKQTMKKKENKGSVPAHKCPYCDAEIQGAGFPYCVACGVQFVTCPSCGTDYSRDVDVCPECGAENRKPRIGI